ncbi:MAG: hypothetical protein ACK540_02525 [Betaproteobacteria bacterium]
MRLHLGALQLDGSGRRSDAGERLTDQVGDLLFVLGKLGNDVGVGKDWAVYRPVRCQPRVPVVPTTPSAQMA